MAPELEVVRGPSARMRPRVQGSRAPRKAARAWQSFTSAAGAGWTVLWDEDTGVPSRIFGTGVAAPGSVESAERAEAHALAFLAQHIDLIAPGARVDDFVVVSNHLGGGMRTIGMTQHHAGMRVLGGQVSFRFKADRLFVVASEALPFVDAPAASYGLATSDAADQATAWIAADAGDAWASDGDGPYILPVISHGSITYHTVVRVTVEAREPTGRWLVYMDAASGELVAREQTLRFAEGTVHYNVPERHPSATRIALPARDTAIAIDGTAQMSDPDGVVSWTGDLGVRVGTSVTSAQVRISNEGGDEARAFFDLQPGGIAEWNARDDEGVDAQLATFIHTRIVKDYIRTFAPELTFLDEELYARVNIDSTCNAFSDGFTINFYRSSNMCQNTGRLADVIYHEFGHVLHRQALIPGVGVFDAALSEGFADYLAATITNDPGMGRGFYYNDEALRHLDPVDREHRWPEDIGEVHYSGLIIAGAMWDLRKALIDLHGYDQGVALADRLYFAAVQRSTYIPTTYIEVLAADDDDGNLDNGTPHECLINDTFGRLHGLRVLGAEVEVEAIQPSGGDGHQVALRVNGSSARCPGDVVSSATLYWGVREPAEPGDNVDQQPNSMPLTAVDGVYSGLIPQQADGSVVRFRMAVTLADGSTWSLPSNLADPAYELYVGDLVELYCTDFEDDVFDFGRDWDETIVSGQQRNRQWEWGTPAGLGLDSPGAYSGQGAIGTDLGLNGRDGMYVYNTHTFARGPIVDVGNFSDVRLHYRRWLTVEDATYDQATVNANGRVMWRNTSHIDGHLHHVDSEWVFHDVPLSPGIFDGTVQVSFDLITDGGLELGGWNVDSLCIVANPSSICGDDALSSTEECDDGAANSDAPDACRTNCRLAACGDAILDTGESCDDGNDVDDDDCTSTCLIPKSDGEGCACAAGGGAPTPALFLSLAGLWLVLRRRRA